MSKVTLSKYSEAMKLKEAAEFLGISEPTMRGKIQSGQIACVKISPRKWRITREALEDYLTRSQSGATQ